MATIRGVNLGGWFVLERWMKPRLFTGVDGPDETIFCKQAVNAYDKLLNHWDTFITEDDFLYIKSLGLNSVRIPIPWWTFKEVKPYYNSLPFIKRAMEWAHRHGLLVLLDLHTAPGCQNGFDNGGITGVIDCPKTQENIDLTVEVLGIIAEEFKDAPALWGIEVLNEPHFSIDLNLIQRFYLNAYQAIRKILPHVKIVFHDSFRPTDPSWRDFFANNEFTDVLFDLHLYQCFEEKFRHYSLSEHIQEALVRGDRLISELSALVPIIVGEWSLGLSPSVFETFDPFQHDVGLKLYALAQLHAYEKGYGWYFWSYRLDIEEPSGWHFRDLVERNIMPNQYGK